MASGDSFVNGNGFGGACSNGGKEGVLVLVGLVVEDDGDCDWEIGEMVVSGVAVWYT